MSESIGLEILFWAAAAFLLYPYLGYPIILYVAASLRNRPIKVADCLPSVSVILSVYNEEKVIEKKITNTLNLDYPGDLLEVIVVSDCSTDRTNGRVARFQGDRVHLLINKERRGKTYGLNRAFLVAKGEILLFTDANAMLEACMLRKLLRSLADPTVGLVTGSTRYLSADEQGEVVGVMDRYTRFEMWLKRLETRISSCVGADGALFVMKKQCYRTMADTDINDLALPFGVVRGGYRAILDPEAYCIEEHGSDEKKEFSRQVRIATRTIQALIAHRNLLNPFRHGLFAWMLFSHKVVRFFFPAVAILLFLLNVFLVDSSWSIYWLTILGAAGAGIIVVLPGGSSGGYFAFVRSFALVNAAILIAWKMVLTGQKVVVWKS